VTYTVVTLFTFPVSRNGVLAATFARCARRPIFVSQSTTKQCTKKSF